MATVVVANPKPATPKPAVPWWAWFVGLGLLLWGASGVFHSAVILILIAAVIYQFTSLIK